MVNKSTTKILVFSLILCVVVLFATATTVTTTYAGITMKNPVMPPSTIATEPVSAVEPVVVQQSKSEVVPVAATSAPEHASVLSSTIVTEHANTNANAIHYSVFTTGPKPKRLRTIKP